MDPKLINNISIKKRVREKERVRQKKSWRDERKEPDKLFLGDFFLVLLSQKKIISIDILIRFDWRKKKLFSASEMRKVRRTNYHHIDAHVVSSMLI